MSSAVVSDSAPGQLGADGKTSGFLDFAGERYFVIRQLDRMAPFLVSVISADDHWLFVSSTGGLTAGRVSPESALFPYVTVDKLHDCAGHTGAKTLLRVDSGGITRNWEPFNREQRDDYTSSFNLYKNTLGNKLCFEDVNHDLGLAFRYTWSTSGEFGFVRDCELQNLSATKQRVEFVDGVQNLLPAGTSLSAQTNTSNLVDAYKWTELDEASGLAFMTLYSGVSDRAEPCESLKATSVFCLGLEDFKVLISTSQLDAFRRGETLSQETHRRGIRGAYFANSSTILSANGTCRWRIVMNTEQSQAAAVSLRRRLSDPGGIDATIDASVEKGSDALARIVASADGLQQTAEENVSVHHYANVLFNVLRGGIFADQYKVPASDFRRTVHHFNRTVFERHQAFLDDLPERLRIDDLLARVVEAEDSQLHRLSLEYLPITFGRRHGDPSRPWNRFAIRLKDANGEGLLSYEGNWRDIFQNWEALALSFPGFIENFIAKFVNASTADGYNPYRITKEGIDWEVEEPDNPWSYIGYWGDHQIIYLLKLLELSVDFHPMALNGLLRKPLFCYANVPYRIKPLAHLLQNPKDTVVFDDELAMRIDERVAAIGNDGKLLPDRDGEVYQVNLLEKLLVPLLAKLGNLVVEGGIWLNTQRPEWNDANNALVGQGLSMVTLYYIRRYANFLQTLLAADSGTIALSAELGEWLRGTAEILASMRADIEKGRPIDDPMRHRWLTELGSVASDYRESLYATGSLSGPSEVPLADVQRLLDDTLTVMDRSILANKGPDGLYHAYNIAGIDPETLALQHLYPMLEGQVAALSASAIPAEEAVQVLDALFGSAIYREDQDSFMLYPDRELPGFLQRNRISDADAERIPLLQAMLDTGDERIVLRDAEGTLRFNADFTNAGDLRKTLDTIGDEYGNDEPETRKAVMQLYESVFNHRAFTGRSGTMFGFEGLGSIYWHMVAKLLLAIEENFFATLDAEGDPTILRRLGDMYYRVRSGIGFNKTPAEYGAFPTDPYSHTPRHAGARQPGMTGQVKEEVLTRFGELGVRVRAGEVAFEPALLRAREFTEKPAQFRYLDVDEVWQHLELPVSSLAFTWCQVPIVYTLNDAESPALDIEFGDGTHTRSTTLALSADVSASLFERTGRVRRIRVSLTSPQLFGD